jgi:dipeptidyl-peptidase-4
MSGWSYGGFISALAVMARPDVFSAAVAGAPVTEWELYDTFYTERYVGTRPSSRRCTTATTLVCSRPS